MSQYVISFVTVVILLLMPVRRLANKTSVYLRLDEASSMGDGFIFEGGRIVGRLHCLLCVTAITLLTLAHQDECQVCEITPFYVAKLLTTTGRVHGTYKHSH